MTEKTFKEKFADWFDDQKENHGMQDFKPYFNHEAIAKQFGAELHTDEYGFFSHLDFSNTPYKTVMHPDVQEYIYKGLYEFVTAPSTRIRNETDRWGRVTDENHPDYQTVEEQVAYFDRFLKDNPIPSISEIILVLTGSIPPREDWDIPKYEREWQCVVEDYESRTEQDWPHPRPDDEEK